MVHELEKRLKEALSQVTETREQQAATSEILRVISSSPTDVQPVFDTIMQNAARLCHAAIAAVFLTDGKTVYHPANYGGSPDAMTIVRAQYPRPLDMDSVPGIAILTRSVVRVPDTEAPSALELARQAGRLIGFRSIVAVPMLREGDPVGALIVGRRDAGEFSDTDVELLKTFGDQAVIAIENVRLFNETKEALEQQTATADILRVISSSQTDVQPVFDAIVKSAVRLLGGNAGALTRIAGDRIELAALTSTDQTGDAVLKATFPLPLESDEGHARVVRARTAINIADAQTDPCMTEAGRVAARARGARSWVVVPLLRHGEAIGTIAVSRRAPGGFTDDEMALLKTFADQAVIAIENVRLFTELQEKNEALIEAHAQVTEALEQQTAAAEILRIISRSPTDTQPVFDAIAGNAARLCSANDAQVLRVEGEVLRLVAAFGAPSMPPVRQLTRGHLVGRAVIDRRTIHVRDLEQALAEYSETTAARFAVQSALAVPLMREGVALGVIRISRTEVRPFTDKQIALVQTFADQAVIAIENVRLFTELQTSNRELTTALDTQTATSDILRVISRSQTDVQPVFDAILASAVRLLQAYAGALTRVAGEQIELVALSSTDHAGETAVRAAFPQPLGYEGPHPQTVRARVPFNIAAAYTDSRIPERAHAAARARGYQSLVVVPMLRQDEAIGTISVNRREPGGFTDDEIALLKTFADQAVIAIENARLLSELQARTAELTQSVGELRALGEVGQAISSTLDLQTVLSTIVARATQLAGADAGVIYEYDEPREVFMPRATEHLEAAIVETMLSAPVRKGEGATGRLAEVPVPIQVPDILDAPAESRVRGALVHAGYRALLAVPLVREDRLLGGLTVIRKATGAFAPEVIELLRTFATQSALAIQNARLFLEIAEKSRELEVASQHKSEFLASMSHELRTPLNAIIGFSDVLLQGMFGETNDKQTEYLRDILASGQHLLSLINDILDLSKIEAGRMDLDLTDFDLPSAIDDAMLLMRERAGRRGITLERYVDDRLGEIHADQRKVKQVLLNLLSNAVKFTPEGGRINVRAAIANRTVEISVTDTGIGIAPEDQEAVFEEFRQVGKAEKKAEGTGLGLALCRKFVDLHGGRIWVKSQIGAGSTFTFTLLLGQ